jgi:hypothetical protein
MLKQVAYTVAYPDGKIEYKETRNS